MAVSDEIREKLEQAFAPNHLLVRDDSEQHRGHAGYQEGGESHFHVAIHAEKLSDMNRLERHRAVHDAIGKELLNRIHALELKIE